MASYIEQEMVSCLSDMEKLQAKFKDLQNKKKEEELKDDKKNKLIEPNMAVMEKWLKIINLEEYEIERKVMEFNTDRDILMRKGMGKLTDYEKTIFSKWNEIEASRTNENRNRFNKCSQIVELFHIKGYKNPDRPSKFMVDFIEAIHNLFQIKQKRIDELEGRIEKLENIIAKISVGVDGLD